MEFVLDSVWISCLNGENELMEQMKDTQTELSDLSGPLF